MTGRASRRHRFLTLCLAVDVVCAVFWLFVVVVDGPTAFRVAAFASAVSVALFLVAGRRWGGGRS